ncbi:hypothetical protein [Xanthobacter oligotrophicus]|uniref:hypothetical protein n=1 Tax=Xanthobacter oligotrophicus TaxID=2607286 RepID=UPI0011F0C440|nr:hypothetical protein [Xanthobacter oligotrophicus]MCG5233969.1 hypothetical protein [Xanthobacter oligotrophicus]
MTGEWTRRSERFSVSIGTDIASCPAPAETKAHDGARGRHGRKARPQQAGHPRHAVGLGAFLVTVGLLLAAPPGASAQGKVQDKILVRFPVGSGQKAVGAVPGAADAEPTGPSALYADGSGKLYLLDQVNGRILSIEAAVPGRVPEVRKLPDNLVPSDLIALKDRLYVWDGRPYALDPKETGRSGDIPVLEARAVGDADDVARSAFAQMGSQTPSSDAEVVNAAGRSLSLEHLDVPVRQVLAARAAGSLTADILPQPDGKSAVVEIRPEADPLQVTRFRVRVVDKLGLVEVLEVDRSGNVFVFTENVPAKAGGRAALFVARYSPRGRLEVIYDPPVAPDQTSTRRFVTITPDGKVLFLKSDATGVAILDLTARKPKGQVLEPPPVRTAAIDPTGLPEPGFITAIRPNSRLGVIQIGLAFEGLKWQVTSANYGPEHDKSCLGFDGRVRRPAYLQGKVGQEVRGVPYCWGCFGSLTQFKRRVDSGTLAGNWCTREDPRRDTIGVDCSAFVSAAWGLSRHYTTADIPGITRRLDNPWDLRPGDALNKPGSHVMLFVQFTPDRKVEVLEAATGGCNGRVCRNIYPLSVLLARGYQPVRYPALTD